MYYTLLSYYKNRTKDLLYSASIFLIKINEMINRNKIPASSDQLSYPLMKGIKTSSARKEKS